MSTGIENLSEEQHAQWHRFIDAVNAAVESCFTDDDHPAVVLGVQWGEMGSAGSDLPRCVVTSNLPVCVTPAAIEDMLAFTKEAHDEFHGVPLDDEGVVKEPVNPESVPEEVRQAAIEWAESMGYTAADVQFIEVADARDLADLPLFDVDSEQESKEPE